MLRNSTLACRLQEGENKEPYQPQHTSIWNWTCYALKHEPTVEWNYRRSCSDNSTLKSRDMCTTSSYSILTSRSPGPGSVGLSWGEMNIKSKQNTDCVCSGCSASRHWRSRKSHIKKLPRPWGDNITRNLGWIITAWVLQPCVPERPIHMSWRFFIDLDAIKPEIVLCQEGPCLVPIAVSRRWVPEEETKNPYGGVLTAQGLWYVAIVNVRDLFQTVWTLKWV